MWKKEDPSALLVGKEIGADSLENNMEVSQKIKNKTTIRSRNSTFGYLSKENEHTNSKKYIQPMFTATLFATAKICPN